MTDDRHHADAHDPDTPEYDHPHGGWGSVRGIVSSIAQERPSTDAVSALARLNKAGGVACNSCAWAKPEETGVLEICENGAKAVFAELTRRRNTPDFFAKHTVNELREWHDHDLEKVGRLTHPLRYDPDADRYLPVSWDDAYAEIGQELRGLDPTSAVFYASGHAGLEASYLYALFARVYGHNNLPQSSNMCHETTSVGLKALIGSPVGTVTLEDFEHCDAILVFGQNAGTNSPRFLKPLQEAVKRGCRIVTFNPLREVGYLRFADPQSPLQMTVAPPTAISEHYYQVRSGGDIAAMAGILKVVLDAEAAAPGTVVHQGFVAEHTVGFEAMAARVRSTSWERIERDSGLTRSMLEKAASVYLSAERVIAVYGMGLTQHVHGFENLAMLTNLLLVRGHIGRLGAGMCPVRGHSNVQGQRTVGIAEDPSGVPLETLEALFDFEAPREPGRNIVATCEGILDGSVRALLSLGGNLARAVPDITRMESAWPRLRLGVHIATKLNRSHLYPGKVAYILPCLGRLDADVQATGPQAVSVEDSLSHIHGSRGKATPPSEHVRSELEIVARLAEATLPGSPKRDWRGWTEDYARVRDLIERTYPDDFRDFNDRLFQAGGFYRGNPARERVWKTEVGKAVFTAPESLLADARRDERTMTLITLRSNDQYNTTVYGFSDRLRGLEGSRMVVLVNRRELRRLGLSEGQRVSLRSAVEDGVHRRVDDLEVVAYDLPAGCVAGYFPELNPLVPLQLHDERSQTPAYKGAPVQFVTE